jgi:hypothetical protein
MVCEWFDSKIMGGSKSVPLIDLDPIWLGRHAASIQNEWLHSNSNLNALFSE